MNSMSVMPTSLIVMLHRFHPFLRKPKRIKSIAGFTSGSELATIQHHFYSSWSKNDQS
tara:strand:- start:1278 stop:1451 length:174 start_codon:yes stop_codon:yes gene_type:complete